MKIRPETCANCGREATYLPYCEDGKTYCFDCNPLGEHARELAAIEAQRQGAMQAALAHVLELEEGWRTGAITSCDGRDGERSNRNIEVRNALQTALERQAND